MAAKKPKTLRDFEDHYPEVWKKYLELRNSCDDFGPLSRKIQELIKIGIEVSQRRHGGLIAHVDRAKAAGATDEEIRHAMVLALPLIGMPDMLDAFRNTRKKLR